MRVTDNVFRRVLLFFVVLLAALTEAYAQYDPSFSHYWAMEPSYNPAAVGKEAKLNVVAAYNMTMAGFKRNPRTMYAAADLPFYFVRSYHGVGAQFVNDQIGLFSHKKLALQYAYRFRLLGGSLAVGVQGGLLTEDLDGSKLDLADKGDPTFSTSSVTGNALDLGAGLYYLHRNWYVGASVQHLTAPKVELGETNEMNIDRTYYLTGGYNIRLRNPFLSIHPSVLGRYDGVGYRADATVRLDYVNDKKVMYVGVGYSPTNSVTVFVGGMFHGIMLGYSYEAYTSGISLGNGSHELLMRYQTDVNLFKKGRNRHQSVRIL